MRVRKQSMRQVTDSAAVERTVAMLGDIALAETVRHAKQVPGNMPRYHRGALIKSPTK